MELNVATTQSEYVVEAWRRAEAGFSTLTAACEHATDLLAVREAQEARDARVAAEL